MRVCRISCAPRVGAGMGLRAQNNNNNNVNFNGWFGWGKKETPPAPSAQPAPAVAVQEPEEDEGDKNLKQKYEIFLKTGVDTRTPEEKAAGRRWYENYLKELREAYLAEKAEANEESARICNARAHGHF